MRGKKSLFLDQNATIVTETDTLAGDIATLYFTEDEQSITLSRAARPREPSRRSRPTAARRKCTRRTSR